MSQNQLTLALGLALGLVAGAVLAVGPDPDRVMIKFRPGTAAQAENAIRAAGGRIHLQVTNERVFAATVPAQALAGLRNNPNVEYVEADAPRYPVGQTVPYGINNVQAPQAWSVGAEVRASRCA